MISTSINPATNRVIFHTKARLSSGSRQQSDGSANDSTHSNSSYPSRQTSDDSITQSERQEEDSYKPGDWWPMLSDVIKAGLMESKRIQAYLCSAGVYTIPLLKGEEELIDDNPEHVLCCLEGIIGNPFIKLLSQVGAPVRIVRGKDLNSLQAPVDGFRYDGVYFLRQYGTKLDPITNLFRLEFHLERVPGQRPMAELINIPLRKIHDHPEGISGGWRRPVYQLLKQKSLESPTYSFLFSKTSPISPSSSSMEGAATTASASAGPSSDTVTPISDVDTPPTTAHRSEDKIKTLVPDRPRPKRSDTL